MKSIKDKIVYFTYSGKLDERSNKLLFQELNDMKESINSRKLSGVFISLQNITCDTKILKILVSELHKIRNSIDVPLSIGEFTTAQFNFLKEETKGTYIKLFKTFGLAQLFLNTKHFKKPLKILMFDDGENEEELDRQASLLTRYEHNIFYTKDMNEFHNKISDPNINFAVSQTKINLIVDKTAQVAPIKLALSRKLITNLPVFIDTAVDNLETMTGLKAQKISHTISLFNKEIDNNIVSAIMQFKGDIEGQFVLIFPKEIALLSIEAMIGEKISEKDTETLCDGIAEFCNIITGGAKTTFSKSDIKVLFELPRTHTSIMATINAIAQNNGIWINMELENRAFYMYIVN